MRVGPVGSLIRVGLTGATLAAVLPLRCPGSRLISGHYLDDFAEAQRLYALLEKTDVNGDDRHPLYAELTKTEDANGEAGDVQWNFEKFLVAPGGNVVKRFRPRTVPDDPEVISAIEDVLPR